MSAVIDETQWHEVTSVEVREQFHYFSNPSNPTFFENAGGSQVPQCVIENIKDYMLTSYVQLGAGYGLANKADLNILRARNVLTKMFNADGAGKVIVGNSTTQLVANLATCYSKILAPGDEIIIHECCHEANAGPWVRLAETTGSTLKWWCVDPESFTCSFDALAQQLSSKTKIVAVTHVSNILGEILDVPRLVSLVSDICGPNSCRIIVDGVAFTPHLPIDVAAWNVDWYVYSTYKTWGPHMAALYGSNASFAELTQKEVGPNHFFISHDEVPYKFEPGGVNHEGCAGIVALSKYLKVLAKFSQESEESETLEADEEWSLSRRTVELAYRTMNRLESPLQERLIAYLRTKEHVTIVGPDSSDSRVRVCTISFVHALIPSPVISSALHEKGFAMRHGHFYAYRLVTALKERLKVDIEDGVVRLSLLHYNTMGEVDRLISALEDIL